MTASTPHEIKHERFRIRPFTESRATTTWCSNG
jgi:hypothetical protein